MFYWFLLACRNSFKFSGRASRKEFWYFCLTYFCIWLAGTVVVSFSAMGLFGQSQLVMLPIFAIFFLSLFLLLITAISLTIRRLHDSNRSGWWSMLHWWPVAFMIPAVITLMVWGDEFMLNMDEDAIHHQIEMVAPFLNVFQLLMVASNVMLIVFLTFESSVGSNDYGPSPSESIKDECEVTEG